MTSMSQAEPSAGRKSKFDLSTDQMRDGNAGYYFEKTKIINILIIGRTQTGKSSILGALQDPFFKKTNKGFSETREPECHSLSLFDEKQRQMYQVNIIDTPGLKETAAVGLKERSDEELLDLAKTCIQLNLTTLNCVCFVSKAGLTHQDDIDVFHPLIQFLGPEYADNSMMILTHCDAYPVEKLQEFHDAIRDHPKSKPVYDYCKLGVFYHGIINFDDLATLASMPDLQRQVMDIKIHNITPMREKLVKTFLKTVGKERKVDRLQEVIKSYEEAKVKMQEDFWEKIKRSQEEEEQSQRHQQQQQQQQQRKHRSSGCRQM